MSNFTIPSILGTRVLPWYADYLELGSSLPSNQSNKFLANAVPVLVENVDALELLPVTNVGLGTSVILQGSVTRGDGLGGVYYYAPGSTATVDGVEVIAPAVGAGRWLRFLSAGGAVESVAGKTGVVVLDTGDIDGLGTVAELDKDIDGTLAADSDSKVATQKAVKTYVDVSIALAALSADIQAALVGTNGTPSAANKFVTDSDSRMSNARTPVGHASSHGSAGSDPVTPAAIGALPTTYLDNDPNLTADSATKIATQQAVRAYVLANAGGGGGYAPGVIQLRRANDTWVNYAMSDAGLTAALQACTANDTVYMGVGSAKPTANIINSYNLYMARGATIPTSTYYLCCIGRDTSPELPFVRQTISGYGVITGNAGVKSTAFSYYLSEVIVDCLIWTASQVRVGDKGIFTFRALDYLTMSISNGSGSSPGAFNDKYTAPIVNFVADGLTSGVSMRTGTINVYSPDFRINGGGYPLGGGGWTVTTNFFGAVRITSNGNSNIFPHGAGNRIFNCYGPVYFNMGTGTVTDAVSYLGAGVNTFNFLHSPPTMSNGLFIPFTSGGTIGVDLPVVNIPIGGEFTFKFNIAHTSFQTGSTSVSRTCPLPLIAGYAVKNVTMKTTTAFAGSGITGYTLEAGVTGDTDLFAPPYNCLTAVSGANFQSTPQTTIVNMSSNTNLLLTAISTGANLSASTAGAVSVWITYARL